MMINDESAMDCSPIERNFPINELYDGLEADGFEMSTASEWIYPTNLPVRDYQRNIVTKALFQNTLVCLPTGLGKTFIAAVVMYNLHRWYPNHKVVFMAHSKPLVAQQIQACSQIMGVSPKITAELNGSISVNQRKLIWATKKIFFLTPQVFNNDMGRGLVNPESIRCLVIDEAHKALGNQAYCQAIKALQPFNKSFRVLALSATPGDDIQTVKAVIENLLISHLELRTEEDVDIKKYLHGKCVETAVVKLDSKMLEFKEKLNLVAEKYLRLLAQTKAIASSFGSLNSYSLLLKFKQFNANPTTGREQRGLIASNFTVVIALFKASEELVVHGLRSFHTKLVNMKSGEGSTNNVHTRLAKDADFEALLRAVEDYIGQDRDLAFDPNLSMARLQDELDAQLQGNLRPIVYSHPKFVILEQIIISHFEEWEQKNESTRVIVFCKSRPCTGEICNFLNRFRPLVKPMILIGQSNTGAGSTCRGFKQTAQLEVMRKFRKGDYNTLVATCVGEEGLDVGEVDLIINFDASRNSNTQIQRSGRTGRKRDGRVVNLLTEGKEFHDYNLSVNKGKTMNKKILTALKNLPLYPHSLKLLPNGIEPTCHEMFLKPPNEKENAANNGKPKKKERKRAAKVIDEAPVVSQAINSNYDIRYSMTKAKEIAKVAEDDHDDSSGSLFESAVTLYKGSKSIKKNKSKKAKKTKGGLTATQTLKQMFEKVAAKKDDRGDIICLEDDNDVCMTSEVKQKNVSSSDIPLDLKNLVSGFPGGAGILLDLKNVLNHDSEFKGCQWDGEIDEQHCSILDTLSLDEIVSFAAEKLENVRITSGKYLKQASEIACKGTWTMAAFSESEDSSVEMCVNVYSPQKETTMSDLWKDDDIFEMNNELEKQPDVEVRKRSPLKSQTELHVIESKKAPLPLRKEPLPLLSDRTMVTVTQALSSVDAYRNLKPNDNDAPRTIDSENAVDYPVSRSPDIIIESPRSNLKKSRRGQASPVSSASGVHRRSVNENNGCENDLKYSGVFPTQFSPLHASLTRLPLRQINFSDRVRSASTAPETQRKIHGVTNVKKSLDFINLEESQANLGRISESDDEDMFAEAEKELKTLYACPLKHVDDEEDILTQVYDHTTINIPEVSVMSFKDMRKDKSPLLKSTVSSQQVNTPYPSCRVTVDNNETYYSQAKRSKSPVHCFANLESLSQNIKKSLAPDILETSVVSSQRSKKVVSPVFNISSNPYVSTQRQKEHGPSAYNVSNGHEITTQPMNKQCVPRRNGIQSQLMPDSNSLRRIGRTSTPVDTQRVIKRRSPLHNIYDNPGIISQDASNTNSFFHSSQVRRGRSNSPTHHVKPPPQTAIVRPFRIDPTPPSSDDWISTKFKPKSPSILSLIKGNKTKNAETSKITKFTVRNPCDSSNSFISHSQRLSESHNRDNKRQSLAMSSHNDTFSSFDCIPDDLTDFLQCSALDEAKQSTPLRKKQCERVLPNPAKSHEEASNAEGELSDGALEAIRAVERFEKVEKDRGAGQTSKNDTSAVATFDLWSSDNSDDLFERPAMPRKNNSSSLKDVRPSDNSSSLKEKQHRKKRRKRRRTAFIDDEAELSDHGSGVSSDENSSGLDEMDSSFLDERIAPTQAPGIDMTAKYLAAVKSPNVVQGRFKMPQNIPCDFNVFSQVDNNDDDYLQDSFCVEDESEAVDNEMSALELAEYILDRRKRRRRGNVDDTPAQSSRKKKRRRIMVMESSSDEETSENRPQLKDCTVLLEDVSKMTESSDELFVAPSRVKSSKDIGQPPTRSYGPETTSTALPEVSRNEVIYVPPISSHKPKLTSTPCIFIGSRQIASAPEITTALRAKWKCRVEVRSLPGADFIVSWRMGINRITLSDFTNGSPAVKATLKEAVIKMKSLFSKTVLIVEDDKGKSAPRTVGCHQDLWAKHSSKRLARLHHAGVQLIFTQSKDETADVIFNLTKIECENGHGAHIDKPQISKELESRLQFYSCLPGINVANALRISLRFPTITSFVSICNSVSTIQKETGVSRVIAGHIYHALFNPPSSL